MFKKEDIELIEDNLNGLTEQEIQELYEDELNNTYGDTTICGYEYSSAHALKLVDRIAYDVGFSDYHSNLLDQDYYEINNVLYEQREVDKLLEAAYNDFDPTPYCINCVTKENCKCGPIAENE